MAGPPAIRWKGNIFPENSAAADAAFVLRNSRNGQNPLRRYLKHRLPGFHAHQHAPSELE